MGDKELERLAELLAEKLKKDHDVCHFSYEERMAVKNLIQTKKNAVRALFLVFGALVLWVLKDIYTYIKGHLSVIFR